MPRRERADPSAPSQRRAARKKQHGANPIDAHVGLRMRQRRTLIGMSQETLATHLDMSFQQVQKYECGANRISASRLFLLTKILSTDISYFFEGLPHPGGKEGQDTDHDSEGTSINSILKRETMELVRAYLAIDNPVVRQQLQTFIRTLGSQPELRAN